MTLPQKWLMSLQVDRVWWTTSRRSIWLDSGNDGGCSQNCKVEMSMFWDTSSTTQVAQILAQHWGLCGLERNLHGHPLAAVLLGLGWEKVPHWECLFVHRKQGLSQAVYVDNIQKAQRNPNLSLLWEKLMKLVDLVEPTLFLTMYAWDVQT